MSEHGDYIVGDRDHFIPIRCNEDGYAINFGNRRHKWRRALPLDTLKAFVRSRIASSHVSLHYARLPGGCVPQLESCTSTATTRTSYIDFRSALSFKCSA